MRKLYLLLLLIISLVSCKNDSFIEIGDDGSSSVVSNYNFGSSAQRDFQGIILSTNGLPVSGATVVIGSKTAQTNDQGLFVISNADVKENFAHVKVSKSGFIDGFRTVVPTSGSNRINIMLIPATNTATITSGTTSTVSLPNGTKVKFDGSFKDANGAAYTGNVNVAMYHLAPSNQYLNELMPGSFLATSSQGNSRVMETYGMLHVQLTGAAGQKLQIANGHTAEMTVAIDASQASTAPSSIPLWSYDESTGIWQEEGSATKVGNVYVGNVSHFSWWNCDVQFPQSVLKVKVKNPAGQPLSNVSVRIKRASQAYDVSGTTDNNGEVSGIVPANEALILKIVDNCGATVYTANVGPFSVGTTTVLPDIILQQSSVNLFNIQGVLKNCAGANITNGFVKLRFAGAPNYFQYVTAQVTNGTFSLNTMGCASNQQFVLEGFDFTNLQTSGEISFTGTSPSTNLGNISVCTALTEFVNYQTDSQAPVHCTLGFSAILEANNFSVTHNLTPVGPSPYFRIFAPGINSVGTYTSGFTVYIGPNSPINAAGNNLTLQISQFGTVGNNIDFTVNGTYADSVNGVSVTRTLSVTGHVKRDF